MEAIGERHRSRSNTGAMYGRSIAQTCNNNTKHRIDWIRSQCQEALDIVDRTGVGFLDPEEYSRASAVAVAENLGAIGRLTRTLVRSPPSNQQRCIVALQPNPEQPKVALVRQPASVAVATQALLAATPKTSLIPRSVASDITSRPYRQRARVRLVQKGCVVVHHCRELLQPLQRPLRNCPGLMRRAMSCSLSLLSLFAKAMQRVILLCEDNDRAFRLHTIYLGIDMNLVLCSRSLVPVWMVQDKKVLHVRFAWRRRFFRAVRRPRASNATTCS